MFRHTGRGRAELAAAYVTSVFPAAPHGAASRLRAGGQVAGNRSQTGGARRRSKSEARGTAQGELPHERGDCRKRAGQTAGKPLRQEGKLSPCPRGAAKAQSFQQAECSTVACPASCGAVQDKVPLFARCLAEPSRKRMQCLPPPRCRAPLMRADLPENACLLPPRQGQAQRE